MGDIFLTDAEPGERDISEPEAVRLIHAMLGDRTLAYKRNDGTKVVAALTDTPDHTKPHGVAELILGTGVSWAEAIASAKRSLRNGRATHLDIRGGADA